VIDPNESLLNISTTASIALNRDAYPRATEAWNTDYELIKENSNSVSTSINDVGTELYKTQVELLQTQVDLDALELVVDGIQTDVTQLQTDVTQLQTDVTQLQTDVTELQDRPFGQASYNAALNVLDGTTVRVPITNFFGSGITLASNALTINTNYTYSYSFNVSGSFGALTVTVNLDGILFNGTGSVDTISITQFKSLVATDEFYVEINNSSGGDINIPDLIVNLSINKVAL
jgi:hypothetical protein